MSPVNYRGLLQGCGKRETVSNATPEIGKRETVSNATPEIGKKETVSNATPQIVIVSLAVLAAITRMVLH